MSENTLPNCLTSIPQADRNICQPGIWFHLYCANCGDPSPYRVRDTELPAQYAFYLCNDCVDKWGEPAGVTKTPDDIWMAKVQSAMQEEYGKVLTEKEAMVELDDPNSVISKLEKEGWKR
jgi:hypothetical protein